MPKIDAYLFFDGKCADAMRFYQEVLGGELQVMRYGEGPPEACPTEAADLVMHACLLVDGRALMASDNHPSIPHEGNRGFAVALNYPTAEEAKRVFDGLAKGGEVRMPLDKTFWAEAFGMLTDKFGIPWMVGGGETS